MKYIPVILLFAALILQSWILTLPLVLLVLIPIAVIYRNYYAFALAFIFGILLDILSFKTIGVTSIFFCVFIFLIFMYERKFEINTSYFVIFASFLGSFAFIIFYGYSNLILETLVSTIIGLILFQIFKKGKIAKGEING